VPPPTGSSWIQTAGGHTVDCRLYWVQLGIANAEANSPQQVVFFDRHTPSRTDVARVIATPEESRGSES